jgi:hypothetical protein
MCKSAKGDFGFEYEGKQYHIMWEDPVANGEEFESVAVTCTEVDSSEEYLSGEFNCAEGTFTAIDKHIDDEQFVAALEHELHTTVAGTIDSKPDHG